MDGGRLTNPPTFADKLALAIGRESITSVADKAGITRQHVYKLLQGSEPSWDTVQRLATALGVSTEAFRIIS